MRCSGAGKQTGGVNLGGPIFSARSLPDSVLSKQVVRPCCSSLVVPCYAHLAASGKSTPGAHWLAWRLTSVLTLVHSNDWWASIDLLQGMLFLMYKEDYIISNGKKILPIILPRCNSSKLEELQQEKHLAFFLSPSLVNATSRGGMWLSLIACAKSWESRTLLPMSAARCPA